MKWKPSKEERDHLHRMKSMILDYCWGKGSNSKEQFLQDLRRDADILEGMPDAKEE